MNCLYIDEQLTIPTPLAELLTGVNCVDSVREARPTVAASIINEYWIDVVFCNVGLWHSSLFASCLRMPVVVFVHNGRPAITQRGGMTVPYVLHEDAGLEEVNALVERIQHDPVSEPPHYFFVRSGGELNRVFYRDIDLIEELWRIPEMVKIVTRYTSLEVSGNLSQWMERLPEGCFVRIADNLVIPADRVSSVRGGNYEYRGRVISLVQSFENREEETVGAYLAYAEQL